MTRNKKLVKLMAAGVAVATIASSMPAMAAFDADFYAKQNPDVVAAVGTSSKALENHYNLFGKNEGRMSSADDMSASPLFKIFDAAYYAKQNPDVANVFGSDPAKLFQHFMIFGMKEGRNISPYFDVQAYKAAYPDLQKAFGDNIALYYQHFATAGIKEHRTAGGFPAENILPSGAKAVTAASSGSSGGGSGSSGGGSAPSGGSTAPSGGSSGGIVIPGSGDAQKQGAIKANTASLDAVNTSLAAEISSLDRTDVNAVLNTINKAQAALDNAKANKEAADEYAAETAAAYKAAGLALKNAQDNAIKDLASGDVAAVKTLTVNPTTGDVTASGSTVADDLYNKAKALQGAENDLVNAQVAYDKALADLNSAKAAASDAAKVVASARANAANLVKAVDPDAYRAVDPDSTASVTTAITALAADHVLSDAQTAVSAYLTNGKVDADKVKTAKDTAAKNTLASYQSAYVSKLIADFKGDDETAKANAKVKLESIFGGTISLDGTDVKIKIGEDAARNLDPSTGTDKANQEKITSATIGSFTTSALSNKTLSVATADAQNLIQDAVDEFVLATDIDSKKGELATAVSTQSSKDGGVTTAQGTLSSATTALTGAEAALETAKDDLESAQGAYDSYYAGLVTTADDVNDNTSTTDVNEHDEALAVANKQKKAGADIKNQIQNAGTLEAVKDAAASEASDAAQIVSDANGNLEAATGANP
ncbi:hypothetical protein SAMN04487831_104222 [Pseudobutyrivibrio sp. UC1225]|uniref:hypothetical protein n=1 Tax=Pseudobutyrivibrio sp. UC1225 TaxID=1798185 RepID=UPI0008F424C3|nr:hypothetical protein [Pseudobutyrivibrio sp. UC1225]SFN88683.1 hypothetical protein SAMN04487831_104222 [Pseudobutyrivibrio sp. UC1225]